MHRITLAPWEANAVLAIDVTWLGRQQAPTSEGEAKARVEDRAMTPELFDALF